MLFTDEYWILDEVATGCLMYSNRFGVRVLCFIGSVDTDCKNQKDFSSKQISTDSTRFGVPELQSNIPPLWNQLKVCTHLCQYQNSKQKNKNKNKNKLNI